MSLHRIVITEPSNWHHPEEPASEIRLNVPVAFLDALQNGVQFVQEKDEYYGYLFGPLYPSETYHYQGNPGQHNRQIGVIDYDALVAYAKQDNTKLSLLLKQQRFYIEKHYADGEYDNPEKLAELQRYYPWVLMVGTVSDFRTDVWAHFDDNKEVDSIILSTTEDREGHDIAPQTLTLPFEVMPSESKTPKRTAAPDIRHHAGAKGERTKSTTKAAPKPPGRRAAARVASPKKSIAATRALSSSSASSSPASASPCDLSYNDLRRYAKNEQVETYDRAKKKHLTKKQLQDMLRRAGKC
jgi:hypothetical protein